MNPDRYPDWDETSTARQPAADEGKLGGVMIRLGFLTPSDLAPLLAEAERTSRLLGQVALGRGVITEEQLYQALAERHGLERVNLSETAPALVALALLSPTMAQVYRILPLALENRTLVVAICDPSALPGLDDLRHLLALDAVVARLARPDELTVALAAHYAGVQEDLPLHVEPLP